MNTNQTAILSILTLAITWATPAAFAADSTTYQTASKTPAKILIEGTSNVHDWEVTGATIDGVVSIQPILDASGNVDLRATFTDGKTTAEAKILISSMTGSRRGMDSRMEKAFDADTHPTIAFVLQEFTLAEEPLTDDGGLQGIASGDLKMAGSSALADFDVIIYPDVSGFRIEGEANLNMTEYGVKPPTALFGAVRTAEDIKITFTWPIESTPAGIAAQ